jgi:hypothetical protein
MPDTNVLPGTLDDLGMTATPLGDPRNGAVGKCFHPADDDPPAALWRSLTEIDTRALAVLAGR